MSGDWVCEETEGAQIATGGVPSDPIEVATKEEAIEMVKGEPTKYFGCVCPSDAHAGAFQARVYPRQPGTYYVVVTEGFEQPEAFVVFKAVCKPLPESVEVDPDEYTDGLLATYWGNSFTSKSPGRGQGVADVPGLCFLGTPEPSDIKQGLVGDCWLLSAISSLAEFPGAIRKLFASMEDLGTLPGEGFNKYTVTLYDLSTWEPVDIMVDERLLWADGQQCLLGCRPPKDGSLWSCVLEKACAAHCGGWNRIDGGQCVHAWRFLTGCKDVYQIWQEEDGTFKCYGKLNPNTGEWEEIGNSPQEGFQGLWPMAWPELGGGGGMDETLDADTLFTRMAEWDAANYLFSCGRPGSDTSSQDGIVDGHAYSVLTIIKGAGGSEFDMIKIRNPHAFGEFDQGDWVDGGSNWETYPEVFEACGRPVKKDDGIFWMEKENFFKHFNVFNLCAQSMT